MASPPARGERTPQDLNEPTHDADGDRPVAAIQRAMQVLDAFLHDEVTLTVAELTQRTGLSKATVLRLLSTLAERNYVVRRPNGEFHVGAKPLMLSGRFHHGMQLEEIVLPVLRELVAVTLESASYILPKQDVRVTLCRVHSPLPVRDHGGPGEIVPLDRGAAGRIFQSFAGAADANSALRQSLIAITRGEIHAGMTGMAAPVFDSHQECIGAIGLTGPDIRFTAAAIRRWEPLLLQAARTLTLRLGGSPRPFAASSPPAAASRAGRGRRPA
ncbi:MAG: IclR family transcriptional regulator [Lautropia sp.]